MSKDAAAESGAEIEAGYVELARKLDGAADVLKRTRKPMGRKAAEIKGAEMKRAEIKGVEVRATADAGGEAPLEDGAVVREAEEDSADADFAETDMAGADAAGNGAVKASDVDMTVLEALLFSTRHPLTAGRIGELVDVPTAKALRRAIAALNSFYESSGRAFRIEQVAGGYQMLTLPQHGEVLQKLHQREIDGRLTRSALETLSIIAYKQPVLRAEVEAIRGVASGETIRSLMEKHLVKIAGRAEEAGRPILYGTTKRFLEVFGLNSLKELPSAEKDAAGNMQAAKTGIASLPTASETALSAV